MMLTARPSQAYHNELARVCFSWRKLAGHCHQVRWGVGPLPSLDPFRGLQQPKHAKSTSLQAIGPSHI